MSEASEIARLQGYTTRLENATNSIAQAITAKGGTVSSGDKLEEFSADIATIPSGGGTHSVSFNTTQLAESGKITASCGGTSSTHTLSSSDDSDFVAEKIAKNVKIFGVTGSYTSDATASASDIFSGKTAYVNGSKVTGTMANNGSESITISGVNDSISISEGYHNGSGKASIADSEKAKLIPANIAEGQTILGVLGSHSSAGIDPSSSTAVVTDIRAGKTAYISGSTAGNPAIGTMADLELTMPDVTTSSISEVGTAAKTIYVDASYTIPTGGGYATAGTYTTNRREGYILLHGATITINDILKDDKSIYIDIDSNTQGENYYDVGSYKWAKVNVQGGGGAPVIAADTTAVDIQSTNVTSGNSLSGLAPGTYNIYAMFSAVSTALFGDGSATCYVYVDGTTDDSKTHTLSTSVSYQPKSYTMVLSNVSVSSSISTSMRCSSSIVYASAVSLIAVKVG